MGKSFKLISILLLLFTFTSGCSDADKQIKEHANEYIDFISEKYGSNIFEYDSLERVNSDDFDNETFVYYKSDSYNLSLTLMFDKDSDLKGASLSIDKPDIELNKIVYTTICYCLSLFSDFQLVGNYNEDIDKVVDGELEFVSTPLCRINTTKLNDDHQMFMIRLK
ncbi:MAG TPA: hypothetical protein DCM01_02860 [Dielma fastidiosa]|jgi:hypothetical protein|nr:hypothetical protein [Dielma fastidiosa]